MVGRSFRYPVSPLSALILIHHVVNSEDAENDADRTVEEIVSEIDTFKGYLSKGVLESALYCCNLEDENKQFWHPWKRPFDMFVKELLPHGQTFNKYYNVICEEIKDGPDNQARR